MKPHTNHRLSRRWLGAGMSLLAALAVQAATDVKFQIDMTGQFPTHVYISGSFSGWQGFSGGLGNSSWELNSDPSQAGSVYTNTFTITDAAGTVENCKFQFAPGDNWESIPDRQFVLGSGTQVLPLTSWNVSNWPAPTNQVTFSVDMSQQVNVGNYTPGQTIRVSGGFNGWGDGQDLTNNPTLPTLASNIYSGTFNVVGIPPVGIAYKFRANLGWEGISDRNASVTNGKVLPLVYYNDAPYAAIITSNISFSVDMSIVALTDTNFDRASVTINGDFCGWGGVAMTNNPSAINTNLYTCNTTYNSGPGTPLNYQFRYAQISPVNTIYDHFNGANGGGGNRLVLTPSPVGSNTGTNILSVFNDAAFNDYILTPTAVFFSVDMNGAVGTDSHVFDSANDGVYINGSFIPWYPWGGGINPQAAPAGYRMIAQGLTSIYTNTIVIQPGPIGIYYKYGIDNNNFDGGPRDTEAGYGKDRFRAIRNTALNPYVMPQDKFGSTNSFGDQYKEPFFYSGYTAGGNLSVGAVAAGKVPVTWLGRPGARLQVKSSLTLGAWQTIAATDGTNWVSGSYSTNGFVSQTNWPAGGNQFFRLIKP